MLHGPSGAIRRTPFLQLSWLVLSVRDHTRTGGFVRVAATVAATSGCRASRWLINRRRYM
jgi:hypothetical protein